MSVSKKKLKPLPGCLVYGVRKPISPPEFNQVMRAVAVAPMPRDEGFYGVPRNEAIRQEGYDQSRSIRGNIASSFWVGTPENGQV